MTDVDWTGASFIIDDRDLVKGDKRGGRIFHVAPEEPRRPLLKEEIDEIFPEGKLSTPTKHRLRSLSLRHKTASAESSERGERVAKTTPCCAPSAHMRCRAVTLYARPRQRRIRVGVKGSGVRGVSEKSPHNSSGMIPLNKNAPPGFPGEAVLLSLINAYLRRRRVPTRARAPMPASKPNAEGSGICI